MAVDSKAVFSARLVALGLGDLQQGFADNGWSTFGEFAFAANFTPGAGDERAFLSGVIEPLLGAQTPSIELAVECVQLDASVALGERRDARGAPCALEAPLRVRADLSLRLFGENFNTLSDTREPFLDPSTLSYTCALYRDPKELSFVQKPQYGKFTLDEAQLNKIHYIIAKAGITKVDHVLELGCGWG